MLVLLSGLSKSYTRGSTGKAENGLCPFPISEISPPSPSETQASRQVTTRVFPAKQKAVPPLSQTILIPSLTSSIFDILLNNHLRNPLPTQRLTRRKLLLLQPRERIESRSDQQHDRSRDQARGVADDGEELDDAHDEVDGGAHVVCLEAADEGVEVLRGGADAQQKRDFDEDEDEGGDAVCGSPSVRCPC
jgi:hypothetical protein